MAPRLPSKWQWLAREGAPRILVNALQAYGTVEVPGVRDSPIIMGWAHEVRSNWYSDDSIPWCGLFMAVMAKRAGKTPPHLFLSALSWDRFGTRVDRAKYPNGALGDVLVFRRKGGGHVGIYVGESADGKYVYVLGGNQDDQVNIKRRLSSTIYAVRRCEWRIAQPAQVRRVLLDATMAPGAKSEQ